MGWYEIAIAERNDKGEMQFRVREILKADEVSLDAAKERALELANGWTPRITVTAAPAPNEAWYFDFEERHLGRDGAWVHAPRPFTVEPKAPR
jgi:hypothetical protein